MNRPQLVPLARALFGALFILAGLGHFDPKSIAFAQSQGVPLAVLAVPLSGLMALTGGLSILLGYRARIGASLLIAFLLPVTFLMHRFWSVADPMMAQTQLAMFMKNMALVGGALLIICFGAGPISLDARGMAHEQA
jgi:putative oxidoreductase